MLERKEESNKILVKGFHTQESHENELESPIKCTEVNAWLGEGYYFWLEEKFAHYWGEDAKNATGKYDVYVAWVECENVINATFDEYGYFFLKERINHVVDKLKELGYNLYLSEVHQFLADNVWAKFNVLGIIFDDLPRNPRNKKRTYSDIQPLYYEKRIQLVTFNKQIIHEFDTFHRGLNCK